jgi:GH24 family phage-related lysozyme (muramidase)
LKFSERALRLILESEGFDNAGWPGGASGVTIGRGYDLGYHTAGQFADDWRRWLHPSEYALLVTCCGVKGDDAKTRAKALRGKVTIPPEAADYVFYAVTIPRYVDEARAAFRGFDKLPVDAQGALVSLVFNRGASMGEPGHPSWDSRREMRAVRDAVARGDLIEVARQIRLMGRLWDGDVPTEHRLPGLIRRREREAELIESAALAKAS